MSSADCAPSRTSEPTPGESVCAENQSTAPAAKASFLHRCVRRLSTKSGAGLVMGNSVALAAERIVKLGLALVITASLGRLLGPIEFGAYSAMLAVSTALSVTADLGTSRVVVRELVRGSAPAGTLLGTAFMIRLVGGILTSGISFLVSVCTITAPELPVTWIAAAMGLGWMLRAWDVVDYGFQARSHCGYPVLARSSVMVLFGVVQLFMIRAHWPAWTFAVAFAAESLLASLALLAMWQTRNIASLSTWRFSRPLCVEFLTECWPMFAAAFLSTIYYKSDLLIVNQLCDPRTAGLYASASRLYDMLVAPIPMITVAVYPLLARWYDDPQVNFRKRYVQLTRGMTLGWMLILGVIAVASPWVLRIFYGPSFTDASLMLSIQCLSALLMANGFLRSSYLNLASQQRILLWTSLLSAALNVGLNYAFVLLWGAVGAAIAGAITQAFSLTLLNLCWRDTRWLAFAHFGLHWEDRRPILTAPDGAAGLAVE